MGRIRGLLDIFNEALNMDAAWEGVKRLGLKEGNTAADRAKALGFGDKTYYHGTDQSFDSFEPNKGFTGGVGEDSTHWFTDSPNVANTYAHNVTVQRALHNATDGKGVYGTIPVNQWMALQNKINKQVGQNSQVYPVKIKADRGSYDMAGESYKDDNFVQEYIGLKLNEAKKYNDSTTTFTNLDDHVLAGANIKPSTHIAVHNPANIRSKFARFNPRLASVGAGSIASADLLASEQPQLQNTMAIMNQINNSKLNRVGNAVGRFGKTMVTEPDVLAETIGGGLLNALNVVSPYIKGAGLGGLLYSSELGSAELPEEEFRRKLRL